MVTPESAVETTFGRVQCWDQCDLRLGRLVSPWESLSCSFLSFNDCLDKFIVVFFTQYCSRLFHRRITRSKKKYFQRSSRLLSLATFSLWPRVFLLVDSSKMLSNHTDETQMNILNISNKSLLQWPQSQYVQSILIIQCVQSGYHSCETMVHLLKYRHLPFS